MEDCTGDVRARFGSYAGSLSGEDLWSSFAVKNSSMTLQIYTGWEPSAEDQTFSTFKSPQPITGETFTLSMMYEERKEIIYEVKGQGKITRQLPSVLSTPSSDFLAVGTRSSNGDGPCTAYIDDVYVLQP